MTNSLSAERLYALLPAVYRVRDAEHGGQLRALLALFASELTALEENLDQLYDDQFIETCAAWVLPYIGELVGYRQLHGPSAAVASPRAEVANTIRYRRRKGTASMLEQLARDVTGCPAHVVEFFERLATTQYMKHVRLHAPATADLRDAGAWLRMSGAFDRLARTVEVRRPESRHGRHNIPNIGIFLWRLKSLRLSAVPLTAVPAMSGRKFRVNPLGSDLALFRLEAAEGDISDLSRPIHVPDPLSVRGLALRLGEDYGAGKSLVFFEAGSPVDIGNIRVSDLRDIVDPVSGSVVAWNHEGALEPLEIGVDPERGRVVLGSGVQEPVAVSFCYGCARAIGGGEYERVPSGADLTLQRSVARGEPLQPELGAVAGGGRLLIGDSLTYVFPPTFTTAQEVVIAGSNGARPLLVSNGDIPITIGPRGRLVLDGLVFSGGALRIAASGDTEPRELVLRDCTLVPGLVLAPDGSAQSPGAPSLIIEHPFAKVTLERCITGPLHVVADAEVELSDCMIDAGAAENAAYTGDASGGPGAALHVEASTVIGKIHTRLFALGSNSIFHARLGDAQSETWRAPVIAERRQEGCLRFSYVPDGSIVPRRHACVPNATHPNAVPQFSSLRYGEARYGQLRDSTDTAIRSGAEHGAEMGVLHTLYLPVRENNLRVRLEEYLRFGLHAGIFYAT